VSVLKPFSIIFICTGNRFRSPLAEAFVHQLTQGLPVTTESYGTLPREDAPALREAVEIALGCGIALAGHRSRYVNKASLRDADLVLGFEAAHVRQAVVDAGAPRDRTFLIDEFVTLLPIGNREARDDDIADRARALVAQVADSLPEATGGGGHGIRDPFGGPWRGYRDSATQIRELSIALVERLFGVSREVLPPIPNRIGRGGKLLRR
jgi:protein-tyrosine-phosphatase